MLRNFPSRMGAPATPRRRLAEEHRAAAVGLIQEGQPEQQNRGKDEGSSAPTTVSTAPLEDPLASPLNLALT